MRMPIKFTKTPAQIHRMTPRLGENSAEILTEAGYSEAEIQALIASGVTNAG